MTNANGNKVPNQFIISDVINEFTKNITTYFQSYETIIAKKTSWKDFGGVDPRYKIELDEKYWDYSITTGKYRNQFLGETKKETEAKIKDGTYTLTNLN
jgi:hypothetical protein